MVPNGIFVPSWKPVQRRVRLLPYDFKIARRLRSPWATHVSYVQGISATGSTWPASTSGGLGPNAPRSVAFGFLVLACFETTLRLVALSARQCAGRNGLSEWCSIRFWRFKRILHLRKQGRRVRLLNRPRSEMTEILCGALSVAYELKVPYGGDHRSNVYK